MKCKEKVKETLVLLMKLMADKTNNILEILNYCQPKSGDLHNGVNIVSIGALLLV